MEGATERRRTVVMGKKTIQEIANALVEKNGLEPEAANLFATEFFAVVLQRLQEGEQVKIKGLGTFKITTVEARESISVNTGERVVIDSHSKVTFIPDTVMKELVNKPFSQFETVALNDGVEFDDMKDDVKEDTMDDAKDEVSESEVVVISEKTEDKIEEPQEKEIAEETEDIEEEIAEETEDIDEETDEEKEESNHWDRWLLMALGVVALMALSAWGGYQYGTKNAVAIADTVLVRDTVFMAELDSTNISEEPFLASDDLASQPIAESTNSVVKEEPKAVVKETPKPVIKEETKSKPAAEVLDKWSAKDERVRLGAYRIVGTAEEVTVQAGQTFYSICRAHLGPDMQCYVEVYNNLSSNPKIKEGQVIKIPKLELKKRKK